MKRMAALLNGRSSGFKAVGFTLIELMMVVTIIVILAAVAVPSYQNYNKRANRSSAAQIMLNISNRQEQYVLDARAYSGNLGSGGLNIAHDGWTCTNDTAVPSTSTCSNAFYTVSAVVATVPPPGYTITAAPIAGKSQVNDGTLTLTSAGLRTRSAGDGKW